MAYNPLLYMPYSAQQMQSTNGIVTIDGIDGANMYMLPPNSVSPPLFLTGENSFIVKTTDGGGAATLKMYSFEETPLPSDEKTELYVTKEHFDNWATRVMEAINGERTASEHQEPEQGQQLDS